MSGQTEIYSGYVRTDFIRDKAGFRTEQRITDAEINTCIKAAEEHINDETNLKWLPYSGATDNPSNTIKEACKFFAVALLRNIYPDDNDTYQKNWDLGTILLESFKKTNPQGQTAVSGTTILSDYNADTNNPDALPDLTSKTFSRDYIPTYRN